MYENLTAEVIQQIRANLYSVKAIHRANLKEIATDIVEIYLPKVVLEKTRAIDEALAELKQKSKADVKAEVRACVKEFIWKDIKKEPKEVKALDERVAQLEPLAIKLTNDNTALMQRNTHLESTTTELRNKIDTLAEDTGNLRVQNTRMAAFINTHHERLGNPFIPGI